MTYALEAGPLRQHVEYPTIASEPPFQHVVRLLRRRGRMIVAVAVVGATLAGIGGLLISPRYTAKAEIVTDPQAAIPLGGQTVAVAPPEDESTVQTYLAALTSRGHLQRVLDSLSRDPSMASANTRTGAGKSLDDLRRQIAALLEGWWSTVARSTRDLLSPRRAVGSADAGVGEATEPSLEAFERHLAVYQERGSHVLAVTYTSTSPEEAARAANRVAQLYVDMLYDQKRENTNRTLAWIGRRIPELKGEVERAEVEVQAYRTEHGLAEGNQTNVVDQKLADLNRQVTAAEATLAERDARLESIREFRHSGTGNNALVPTLDSPALRELRSREAAALQSEAELSATLGEMHPKTRAVVAQLQELRAKIGREVDRSATDLDADAKFVQLEVRLLRERLARAQSVSSEARGAEVHLHDLEHGAATIRQVYENLLQRREQLTEQQEMIAPDVRILSLAVPPDRPSSVNPLLFTFPAFVAFLIGGGLLAVAGDRLDQGLRSARDVSEALGIPCIALVPEIRRKGRMRLHHHLLAKPFAPYAEAIRSVVASLQLASPHGVSQTILISSSVPREGKTTLAASLAVYAALLGRRVILVDLDFRRPAILREIGGRAEADAPDPSSDDRLSAAAIQSIPSLGLDILPVRRRPDDPLLPFAGGELRSLLSQLRRRYDCVVIDSPPLLAVTEARLLATLADKILFVVRWGSTRRDVAQNALRLLRDTRLLGNDSCDVVSAVVTQVDLNKHARYRYGDVGESFVRYARYYIEDPGRSGSEFAAGSRTARSDGELFKPMPPPGDA